jgi:dipeptidyl aminopeptidase/acylaminoacyl peptidase
VLHFPPALVLSVLPLLAEGEGYRLPPPEIVRVLDAPETPGLELSPDGKTLLFVERPTMPSIADVSRPWTALAGVRVDLARNAPQQASFARGLRARALEGGAERTIELPAGARIGDVSWAPTSARFAFTLAREDGVDLYTCEAGATKPMRVAENLNGVLGGAFAWSGDGNSLLVKVVDRERGGRPAASGVPSGPVTQESSGRRTALRTYTDLLRDADDERLFEHCARSRVLKVDAQGLTRLEVGAPGLYASVDPSPDGQHLLVTRIHRPFSYLLPAALFPAAIEVWDAAGKLERLVVDAPLGDDIPMEGVRTGPRSVQWQASAPATLWWTEAQDGGDPKTAAAFRDEWRSLPAPFQGEARPAFKLVQRAQGLRWLADPARVLAGEFDRDKRWTKTTLFELGREARALRVVDDRSQSDRYGDPGAFASTPGPFGERVLRQDGRWAYRIGQGASAEGARPFLDRYDLESGKAERLWQCAPGCYESVVAIVRSAADALPRIVTSRESRSEAPNYFATDLAAGASDKARVALTSFGDPQPEVRGVSQQLVKYKRADGVELSAKLYLPPGYKEGTRLPLFVWAYPLEFTDNSVAGQVSGSPERFVRVRGPSQLLFALHGYAVLDDAAMPVVGDPETVNDTFLKQIVMNAEAAIDEAVKRGVADRERVAVGGHSYGAFMTANLLAHCDLFRAGIARSGAYNRTLTPFGFQSERRTLWEAPKPYLELSPFLSADKLDEPILFIHGEKDSNQGTFPIQSERMYQAVKGNGGTARLVVLPGEAHGYAARESVLHTVAEMFDWCDKYVRDAQPKAVPASAPARSAR